MKLSVDFIDRPLHHNMKLCSIFIIVCLFTVIACAPQTRTQKGGMVGAGGGAAAGALVGYLIGKDAGSTLIGAAIGAAAGGAAGAGVGRMMDNQERDMREALAESEAAAIRREGNLLAISLRGDVTFDTDSSIIKPGMYSEIDRIAGVLNQYPDTVIRIEGHADSRGSEQYNMELSGRRAAAVQNMFIQRGLYRERVEAISFGESSPIASNETAEGRARNRRVEIKVAPAAYAPQG